MTKRAARSCWLWGPPALLALIAAFALGSRSAPAASSSLTHIVSRTGRNCLEGHFWTPGVPVDIKVKDSAGNVIFPKPPAPPVTVTPDSAGDFSLNLQADRVYCHLPITLAPGMTYTASDGPTTKSLLIQPLSFDQLDPAPRGQTPEGQAPEGQTAAGTAFPGAVVQVSVYWDAIPFDPSNNVYIKNVIADSAGGWFVDVKANGGQVDSTSLGDVFLPDDGADGNFDFTEADVFVTELSLSASSTRVAGSSVAAAAARAAASSRRVLLSGKLHAADRVCTKRKRVRLLRVAGRRSKVLASTRTTRKGRYRFLRSVKGTTSFKVRYRGDRICQRSDSRIRTVRAGR